MTPLFMAAQDGQTDVVRLVVEGGADVDKARIGDGVTPLYLLLSIMNV